MVVHDLRRLRRAVPGRHRARRRTSSTCAATRRSSSRRSPPSSAACSRTSRTTPTRGAWRPRLRLDWAKDLPFEVKVRRARTSRTLSEVDYLFWVGCAGAYEDRAKKTTRAVAELLDTAGRLVRRARRRRVLHRRPGPPRRQRVPLPDARPAERRDPQRGRRDQDRRHLRALLQHASRTSTRRSAGSYEVVHHTQLLNRLVREKQLVPVAAARATSSAHGRRLDRADGDLPRPLLPRPAQRRLRPAARAASARCPASSCARWSAPARSRSAAAPAAPACGWRRSSAPGSTPTAPRRPSPPAPSGSPSAARSAGSCSPTASTAKQADGEAREEVEVVDVAQMLLAAVRRGDDGGGHADARRPSPSPTPSPPPSPEPGGRHTSSRQRSRRPPPRGGLRRSSRALRPLAGRTVRTLSQTLAQPVATVKGEPMTQRRERRGRPARGLHLLAIAALAVATAAVPTIAAAGAGAAPAPSSATTAAASYTRPRCRHARVRPVHADSRDPGDGRRDRRPAGVQPVRDRALRPALQARHLRLRRRTR